MNAPLRLFAQLALLVFVILLVNWYANKQAIQLDLTQEKRYSLTESTKKNLANLEEPVKVFVFLKDNNLPTDLKRLQNATREILQTYKRISKGKVSFVFQNPIKGMEDEQRQETMLELQRRGITPTNVRIKTDDGYSENLVYPGALINYQNKQFPVMLLGGQGGRSSINRSIELLEFKFSNAIAKLQLSELPTIGFTQSNQELNALQTQDLRKTLAQNFYRSKGIRLKQIKAIPDSINLLIIAKPQSAFSKEEKFKIDQYIMQGGKTLWAIDMMKMNLDSLRTLWQGQNVAVDFNLNIDDQLFTYGVRIKRNFIRDLQSKAIPVVIDETGQTDLFPWTFFPVVSGKEEHITTKNIDPVSFEFVSEIDTLRVPEVTTTVMLQSSQNAGVVANPVFISLEELRNPPPTAAFALQNLPMAVLLEGRFKSLFQYRATPVENWQAKRIDHSQPTKMAVIADGDFLRNEVLPGGEIVPLGYDRVLRKQFGNKEFLMNLIDYLVLENNALAARNKQVEMRLLNQTKVEEQKAKWQFLAFALPLAILFILCGVFYLVRKKRFG